MVQFLMGIRLINSRGSIEEQGTFTLIEEFVRRSRLFERMLYATILEDPQGWFLCKMWFLRAGIRHQIPRLAGELSVRYRGILREILRRAGTLEVEQQSRMVIIWQKMAADMRMTEDYRTFSKLLWLSVIAAAGYGPESLKPKLMLRQFVDEMPPCEERGVLRALAYGDPGYRPTGEEALRSLAAAYSILNNALMARENDLPILTDHVFSALLVNQFQDPYVEYDNWLFNA